MSLRLVASTVVALLVLAGCGSPDEEAADGRSLTVTLAAGEYFFRADEAFELRAGDEVTFVVRNEGELDHRLEVLSASSSSLGRTERVAPGAQREVTVTFDEPGTYRVICDVDDHLSRGQQAGFEVGPPAATG